MTFEAGANGERLILNVRGGFRIVVPRGIDSISTYTFLEQEDWFEDEGELVRRLARPGFRMLDIGSNVGFYSLAAAAASGRDASIIAFEPTPEIAAMLRASIDLNGFAGISVREVALGASEGTLVLARGADTALNRIVSEGEGARVPVMSLDTVAEREGLAGVDFVKIDVEGAESAVIAGGRRFLERESPLVMFEIVEGGELRLDAARMLEQLGYRLFELAVDPPLLLPFSGNVPMGRLNLFAAKPDRVARLAAAGLLASSPEPPGPVQRDEIVRVFSRPAALADAKPIFRRAIEGAAADDPFLHALSAYAQSLRPDASPDRRAGCLRACFEASEAAIRWRVTAPRLILAARIARLLGMTTHAGDLASQLAAGAMRGARLTIDEPFPPLLPDYETWKAPGGIGQWLAAMVIEASWMWSAFSDQFRTEPFPVSDPCQVLATLGRRAAVFERRRQLLAMRLGLQKGPVASEILGRKSRRNLNPDYWTCPQRDNGA
jgi:FkbM family methyltransferase